MINTPGQTKAPTQADSPQQTNSAPGNRSSDPGPGTPALPTPLSLANAPPADAWHQIASLLIHSLRHPEGRMVRPLSPRGAGGAGGRRPLLRAADSDLAPQAPALCPSVSCWCRFPACWPPTRPWPPRSETAGPQENAGEMRHLWVTRGAHPPVPSASEGPSICHPTGWW